jgi:dUTP pyrophosphatase
MEFNNKPDFTSFYNKIITETAHEQIMHLTIFIDSNDTFLKNMYLESSIKHNNKIMNDPHFYDAGFDLFLPINEKTFTCDKTAANKVDFKVKCCAKMHIKDKSYFTPFYTYARSSISKTPVRLANNQGIIDAGYRGSLIGMFDCIYDGKTNDNCIWQMEAYSRLLQICAPGLIPIYVTIVDTFEELGPSTSRGDGGFGSTGK